MPTCQYCGGWIEFRIVDNRAIPIHDSGGCPFGGSSWGLGRPYTPRQSARGDWFLFHFDDYPTYTIPNARCPVCGAEVFFYQSPFGGRVFFDELGPPWPKHPCTDTDDGFRSSFQLMDSARLAARIHLVHSKIPEGRQSSSQSAASERMHFPEWLRDGWRPFLCHRAISGPGGLRIEGITLASNPQTERVLHFRQASLRDMVAIRSLGLTIGRDLAQNANRIIDHLLEEVIQVRLDESGAEFSTITVGTDGEVSIIAFRMTLTQSTSTP